MAKKPFSAYLRRFTYDIISHDPGALRYLVATVGADRVVLGTDFCFDMGYERPVAVIQAKAVGLSRKDQDRVIASNAARLLRLTLGPAVRPDFWVIQTFNGLSYGALLFLLASGLSLIFGVMRIVNLAHGSYFMLGGYVGLTVALRTRSFALALLARRGGHRPHRHGHGALLPPPPAGPDARPGAHDRRLRADLPGPGAAHLGRRSLLDAGAADALERHLRVGGVVFSDLSPLHRGRRRRGGPGALAAARPHARGRDDPRRGGRRGDGPGRGHQRAARVAGRVRAGRRRSPRWAASSAAAFSASTRAPTSRCCPTPSWW